MEASAALSCCRSDEAVSAAGGTTMSGVVCARGAVCGANQPSWGDEFASIALAVSPYDCQAMVAPIPMENMIRKRARPREALLPSDGRWMIASRDGLVDRSAENSDASVSKGDAPFLLAPEASGIVGVAPSASARLGVAGRGPWAAASQTFLPTFVALPCPSWTCLRTSEGTPQVALFS